MLPLSVTFNADHAAEETHKHAHEVLRSQPTGNIDKIFKKQLNKSNHNTCNQNTRDFIKKCKFCDSSHPLVVMLSKFVMFAIKRVFSNFCPGLIWNSVVNNWLTGLAVSKS